MKSLALIVAAVVVSPCAAQNDKAVSLEKVNRYADGSAGAVLIDATGRTAFHIGLTPYRCDLIVGAAHEDRDGARRLVPGSDEEGRFLARLAAWSKAAFEAKERATIEAAADVHHRGSGWSFDRYKEAAVVNRLAHYRLIRGAEISDVFPGRATVHLSFKVRDGLGREQLVLFRQMEEQGRKALARPHLGDAMTPVVEGSLEERWVLQAMRSYSQANVPKACRDALWAGHKVKAKDTTPEAMSVLSTLVAYKRATSPRITGMMHARDGGSTMFQLVDARGQAFAVRFDKRIGSDHIGRMMYSAGGDPEALVAFGSARETELLAGFNGYLQRGGEKYRDHLSHLLSTYTDLVAEEAEQDKKPATKLERANCYRDGTVSGALVDEHGRVEFCMVMTEGRCELFVDAMRAGHKNAKRLEPGSVVEQQLVARLVAWAKQSYTDSERAAIEAQTVALQRAKGWTTAPQREAGVVHRLAQFRRIRDAKVIDVFLGRGTVFMSVKVRDGLGKEQVVLFRFLEDGAIRAYIGDASDPVALDSYDELVITESMHRLAAEKLTPRTIDMLWKGAMIKPTAEYREPMMVMNFLIKYRRATSPRIVDVHHYLDGGSTVFLMAGPRGERFQVRFDKSLDSKTPGRMWYKEEGGKEQLVAFDSPRETELLKGLRAHLKRGGPDEGNHLKKWLTNYETLK